MIHRRRPWPVIVMLLGLAGWSGTGEAHRSGCHRWHSYPSDRGTYACGDLRYCSQCQDKEYCLGGKPEGRAKPPAKPETLDPTPLIRSRT